MHNRSGMEKRVLAISMLIVCVIIASTNGSFGLGYYGANHHGHSRHHGNHHSNFRHFGGRHHSSFGHHGRHYSHNPYGHQDSRLYSNLYRHHSRRLNRQHSYYRHYNGYGRHNGYGTNNTCIHLNTPIITGNLNVCPPNTTRHNYVDGYDTYEYSHKEKHIHKGPYIFDYEKDYIPSPNAYVFQYEHKSTQNNNLYADSKAK